MVGGRPGTSITRRQRQQVPLALLLLLLSLLGSCYAKVRRRSTLVIILMCSYEARFLKVGQISKFIYIVLDCSAKKQVTFATYSNYLILVIS